MKLSDFLKQYRDLKSKDVRDRFKNKQIKINGEQVNDVEVDITGEFIEAGEFIFNNIVQNNVFLTQCQIFGFENLFKSNISNDLTIMLSQYLLLRTSKKELLLIKKNDVV